MPHAKSNCTSGLIRALVMTEFPTLKASYMAMCISQLNGSMEESNISIYFFFPPITKSCSVSDVLFTGGRAVSDFSVLKCY